MFCWGSSMMVIIIEQIHYSGINLVPNMREFNKINFKGVMKIVQLWCYDVGNDDYNYLIVKHSNRNFNNLNLNR